MHQIDKDELKAWINDKVETTMNNLAMGQFIKALNDAININDTSIIKELVSPKFCNHLTQDEKEQMIFRHLKKPLLGQFPPNDFLHYLIFDYNISEKNSIESFQVTDEIKAMFQARKLDEELRTELEDSKSQTKKPKV